MAPQVFLWKAWRYARPRTRRQGESPAGDWHRRFHGRLRGVASAAVKSPSPPFGFRPAAGHERRPSPHTKTPASRASRTEGEKVGRWPVLTFREISCAVKAAFVSRRGEEARKGGGAHRHRRDEVSSRVAGSPRRIGNADLSPRRGSWSRVAPRLSRQKRGGGFGEDGDFVKFRGRA